MTALNAVVLQLHCYGLLSYMLMSNTHFFLTSSTVKYAPSPGEIFSYLKFHRASVAFHPDEIKRISWGKRCKHLHFIFPMCYGLRVTSSAFAFLGNPYLILWSIRVVLPVPRGPFYCNHPLTPINFTI